MEPYIVPAFILIAGALGFFIARELSRADRTETRTAKQSLNVATLNERLNGFERQLPLLLREDTANELGQRSIFSDQNRLRDEITKLRGDVATSESDVTGKLNSFISEVRATFTSINDRLAQRDARQLDNEMAQKEILSKLNELSVNFARLEAKVGQPHTYAPATDMSATDRALLEALRAAVAKGA